MKLTAKLNKENHEISFEHTGERVLAQVDERSYELSVRPSASIPGGVGSGLSL